MCRCNIGGIRLVRADEYVFARACINACKQIRTAVADGERKFKAIAVAGGKNGEITAPCTPCGVCRQALSEFCDKDLKVLIAKPDGYDEYTLGELLPKSFEL